MRLVLILLLAAAPSFDESFRAGLLALQRNDLAGAETHLAAAAALAPGNGRVQIALAQTYRKLNQAAKADAAAARAAALGERDALVQKSLAIYYGEGKQPFQAAEAQTRYSQLNPQDTAGREQAELLYFQAIQPWLQQRKFSEAIAVLMKARATLQNSAQLELALGVAYYGLRQFDEAAGAFLATIAIAPEIDQPYVFLGKSLEQIPGRLEEVTRAFVSYEKAHPERSMGYVLHAKALIAQSLDPEGAQRLLEKAIRIEERDAAAHFELGAILFRQRRYAEAAREFERSAALEPDNPATHYRLASIYSRLGRHEAAQAEHDLHAKLVKQQESQK